jgi:radical S-adenosyl methionine domain-containing protein 2
MMNINHTIDERINIKELVVNYFVTKSCNFSCKACYSEWDNKDSVLEKENTLEKQKKLISELYGFFKPLAGDNYLTKKICWDTVRINFSGGEPLLIHHIDELIQHAGKIGFKVSVTTNGSLLNEEMIAKIADNLLWLGFSIDSCSHETNKIIGRVDCHGGTADLNNIERKIKLARMLNPNIKIKINTVVSTLNLQEDFSAMVAKLCPDKWTVVQTLPIVTDEFSITGAQFLDFVAKHKKSNPIAENVSDYTESFILVTPGGRFFSNGAAIKTGNYHYSECISEIGVHKAFNQINFNLGKYLGRYRSNSQLYID